MAELNKLNLENDETAKRLGQKWYLSRVLIQVVVAGVIAGGLMVSWGIGYLQPILSKKQELADLTNKIQTVKNEMRIIVLDSIRQEITKQLTSLAVVNDSLQSVQANSLQRATSLEEQLTKISGEYARLAKKKEVSDSDRSRFGNN